MPAVRSSRNRKPPPEGFEDIEDTLLEFSNKMKDAENASHEGKKRNEVMWPIFQITHQRMFFLSSVLPHSSFFILSLKIQTHKLHKRRDRWSIHVLACCSIHIKYTAVLASQRHPFEIHGPSRRSTHVLPEIDPILTGRYFMYTRVEVYLRALLRERSHLETAVRVAPQERLRRCQLDRQVEEAGI